MRSIKSSLPRTLPGRSTTVRSIRQLTLCLVLLAWVGPAMGAKLRVPSVKFPTIQAAIDQAQSKDDLEVAPGTYYENIDFHGKAVRLYGRAGASATTIDGGGNGSVVTCANGETADTILEGFTITGGNAYDGGGMLNLGSNPTVTNCTFSGNEATYGGGMSNRYNGPTVTNCTFSGNSATYGGGMCNFGDPTVTNCTFGDNWARAGGGMCNDHGSPIVTNCTFRSNHASSDGGGMLNIESSPIVTNCTIRGNAGEEGGGMYNFQSDAIVTNCTFSGNVGDGGGIFINACGLTVTNCILWSDSGGEIHNVGYYPAEVAITYSDIQGGFPGEGNVDADPLLDDTGHLQVGSPCVDAGNSAAVPDGVTTDLDGDRRIQDTSVDMGAYESSYKAKKAKP